MSCPEDGVFGAGAHSDYGLLTILATDSSPGLQILHNGAWMDVPAVDGALLINLGDMAERCATSLVPICSHAKAAASLHIEFKQCARGASANVCCNKADIFA